MSIRLAPPGAFLICSNRLAMPSICFVLKKGVPSSFFMFFACARNCSLFRSISSKLVLRAFWTMSSTFPADFLTPCLNAFWYLFISSAAVFASGVPRPFNDLIRSLGDFPSRICFMACSSSSTIRLLTCSALTGSPLVILDMTLLTRFLSFWSLLSAKTRFVSSTIISLICFSVKFMTVPSFSPPLGFIK